MKRQYSATIRFGASHNDLTLNLGAASPTFDMTGWSKAKKKRVVRELATDVIRHRAPISTNAAARMA